MATIAVHHRSRKASALTVALLHLPLAAVAVLALQYGWIVQVLAMGCDTGAALCRAGLRTGGEMLATVGPSVLLVVSVVVSARRIAGGRESGWVPVLGIVAAAALLVVAGLLVLSGVGPAR